MRGDGAWPYHRRQCRWGSPGTRRCRVRPGRRCCRTLLVLPASSGRRPSRCGVRTVMSRDPPPGHLATSEGVALAPPERRHPRTPPCLPPPTRVRRAPETRGGMPPGTAWNATSGSGRLLGSMWRSTGPAGLVRLQRNTTCDASPLDTRMMPFPWPRARAAGTARRRLRSGAEGRRTRGAGRVRGRTVARDTRGAGHARRRTRTAPHTHGAGPSTTVG